MEGENAAPLIVLMYGDRKVSMQALSRELGVKRMAPCRPEVAERHSSYQVGGTSPFATKKAMPTYVEAGVLDLPAIWINGGRRRSLLQMVPSVLVDVLGARPVRCALADAPSPG